MTEDRLVGGWLLLTVTEDLVGAGAARLRQRLLVNSPARHRYLVLDLSAVDRIDSTGLGVLVGARKRLRAGNGQLRRRRQRRRRPGAARRRPGQGAAAVPRRHQRAGVVTPHRPQQIN
jgi:anti-anti-sigma factor